MLVSYDAWKTTPPPEAEDRGSCPVCEGCEEGEPCSEECASVLAKARQEEQLRERVSRLYDCAHRALRLARRYRAEGGARDARLAGALAAVQDHRATVRKLRLEARS